MLESLNRKKKEYEAKIESCNDAIAKLEVEKEAYETKIAIIDEIIDEESNQTASDENVVVVTYGSSQN